MLTVRLPKPMKAAIRKRAGTEDRSVSYVTVQLLQRALKLPTVAA